MRLLNFIALLAFASLSNAFAANVAPFGQELGVATIAQVKEQLGGKTRLSPTGTNEYSRGAMLETDGSGLEIEGLQKVQFIFDPADKLAGAVLTMNKDPKGMVKMLSAKYKLVANRVDNFMNYGTARFEKGDSLVEVNAPHLSFSMTVVYTTKALNAAFNKSVDQEAAAKQQRKAGAL